MIAALRHELGIDDVLAELRDLRGATSRNRRSRQSTISADVMLCSFLDARVSRVNLCRQGVMPRRGLVAC